jgi:hypothetical protein
MPQIPFVLSPKASWAEQKIWLERAKHPPRCVGMNSLHWYRCVLSIRAINGDPLKLVQKILGLGFDLGLIYSHKSGNHKKVRTQVKKKLGEFSTSKVLRVDYFAYEWQRRYGYNCTLIEHSQGYLGYQKYALECYS